jgi:hypothetical protein
MIPAQALTSHTIFVLKTAVPLEAQRFLCGVFNSYVANYLIRLRGGTHVPAATIDYLPVPRPDPEVVRRVAAFATALSRDGDVEHAPAHVQLQAHVARMYGLTSSELDHILQTFPLVDAAVRDRIRAAFSAPEDGI